MAMLGEAGRGKAMAGRGDAEHSNGIAGRSMAVQRGAKQSKAMARRGEAERRGARLWPSKAWGVEYNPPCHPLFFFSGGYDE